MTGFHSKSKNLPVNFEACMNENLFPMEMFLEQLPKSTSGIASRSNFFFGTQNVRNSQSQSEMYSEPCETFKIKRFVKAVDSF